MMNLLSFFNGTALTGGAYTAGTVGLLLLCILSSGFTGNVFKKVSDASGHAAASITMPSVWLFCLGVFFTILALVSKETFVMSSVPVAVVSGLCIATAASILLESMKANALSVAVIIVNLNFVIPVLCSTIFLKEKSTPLQLGGMLLCMIVIVLLNMGGTKNGEKVKKSSILLPLVACIANGMVNFCIKINDANDGSSFWFFAIMYGSGAVFCLLTGVILNAVKGRGLLPVAWPTLKRTLPFMLLIGLCNGVCFYTASLLAGRMNAAAQFTVVTCASILLSLAVGFLFQGDRFNKKSAVTILFCIAAVLCQYSGIA